MGYKKSAESVAHRLGNLSHCHRVLYKVFHKTSQVTTRASDKQAKDQGVQVEMTHPASLISIHKFDVAG